MIKFDIITIFPDIFTSYFSESIVKRAQQKKLVKINIHNLRNYTTDKHKTVDDKPFGGGPGMVMMIEPIFKAMSALKKKQATKNKKQKTILFSPKGKRLDQKMVKRFSKLDQLILICGRYEGVDERVTKHIADEEISIGDYILTGGEIPAMIFVDAITRLIPGVLGKKESLEEIKGSYPVYTRPDTFNKWKVPRVLLSGDHKKIEEWRQKHNRRIRS
jgi:tRNA (guanine37-N1)-methyltransferase